MPLDRWIADSVAWITATPNIITRDQAIWGAMWLAGCGLLTIALWLKPGRQVHVWKGKPEKRSPKSGHQITYPWFSEIENAFSNQVKVLAVLDAPPEMIRLGDYPFPFELKEAYEKNVKENKKKYDGKNEGIASFKRLSTDGAVIEFEEFNFVQMMTLRNAGRMPRAVYAGAILVCPETESIYVHRRSPSVAVEPGKLHAFLGAFIVRDNWNADGTLLAACGRELYEESGASPNLEGSRTVIVENLNIGWIDVMFLGATITARNASRLRPSPEGEIVRVGFDDIGSHFCANKGIWVNNGIVHHLIWLKLGAPGAPESFRVQSEQLYSRILAA